MHRLKRAEDTLTNAVLVCQDCLTGFSLRELLRQVPKDPRNRMTDLIRIQTNHPSAPKMPMADWLPLGIRPEHCFISFKDTDPTLE